MIQSIDNIFSVGSVPKIYKTDVRFNIIKRREHIIYKGLSNADNVNLAYVINEDLTTDSCVSVIDRSWEFIGNRIPTKTNEIVFTGKTCQIKSNRFLITNKFLLDKNNSKRLPLFYKHVLQQFSLSNPALKLLTINIVDQNFLDVKNPVVVFDMENGVVFNNLENSYDAKSGDSAIYYVKYTIYDANNFAAFNYIELLNNESTFRQATFDDISLNGLIDPKLQVYTLDQLSSNVYEITLPAFDTYALKEQPNSIIRIIKPPTTSINNSWNVSVSNGSFYAPVDINPTTQVVFLYSIQEYGSQVFLPFAPYKFMDQERAALITNSLIKVSKENLYVDTNSNVGILIKIKDINNVTKFVISNDSTKIGSTIDSCIVVNTIRSVDKFNGIVDCSTKINDTDYIYVSYFFEEKDYEVFDIDFNPISNTDIIEQRVVFYTVPTMNGNNKSVFYLKLNKFGRIVYTSQSTNLDLINDINTGAFYYDAPSTSPSNLNFIDKYTVQAVQNYKFANPLNPHYLLLGSVTCSSSVSPDKSAIFDARVAGGGLKKTEGLIESLLPIAPELQWITDIGMADGLSYPGVGAFICEVPTQLQAENGGSFTDRAIRDIIERHMAFGEYPIVRGYSTDIKPTLETITSSLGSVSLVINWRSFGATKTYNIYYSEYELHDFKLANLTPTADNSSGNTYTISTGLISNKIYWVYVVESNNIDLPQTIIGPTSKQTYQDLNKVCIKTYTFPT